MKKTTLAVAAALLGGALTACSAGHDGTHAAVGKPNFGASPNYATHSASPPPATTYTITPPSSPAAPLTVTKTMSGTGSYATSPIHFGCVMDGTPLVVKYRYSGSPEEGLAAWLEDGTGTMVGNNNIASSTHASGSGTANIYLDPDTATPPFHLNIADADQGAHWSFTFTCDKG